MPPRKPYRPPVDDGLWKRVARTVTPLGNKTSRPAWPERSDFANMMRIPPVMPETALTPDRALELNGDKKTRRGRVEIEMRVDLHDKTQAEALPLLRDTIERASKRGAKCVLVITGKGMRMNGVLRGAFPSWINRPDIRPHIASYAQSHIKHGGAGAWYVFIKSG